MPSNSPSEYRYHLTTKEFVFAVTADDEIFATRADEMREKGVERLTGEQINEMYNLYTTLHHHKSLLYTFIHEARVDNHSIILDGINGPIHDLLIYLSHIPHIRMDNCQLGQCEDGEPLPGATNFYIDQSTTGNFNIDQSTAGDFHIYQSTTGDFIIAESMTGDFIIAESTTGYFNIAGSTTRGFNIVESTTGGFNIDQSTTEEFRIWEQSTTRDFYIFKSTTGYFIIAESTTRNFTFNQSTAGYFYIAKSTTGNFNIDQSAAGYFDIAQSTTGDFIIRDQSVTADFSVAQSTTGYFEITQSITRDFEIINSTVDNFTGSDLYNSMFLQKATIAEIRLTNCHIPSLVVRSGCKAEMYITDSAINLIDLRHLTLSKESVLSLFNCSIYACLMEEFMVLGNLFFRQSQMLSEPFPWYSTIERIGNKPDDDNEAVLRYNAAVVLLNGHAKTYNRHLMGLTTNEIYDDSGRKGLAITAPTFRIAQSSLGKTEFTNCDLGSFRFEYNSAKITEVFMSGGTVPEAGIVIYNATSENREERDLLKREEQKVSVYNQLKKIFEGQGDIYWATHFQSKTAEHQTEVLKIRWKSEKGWFSTTLWDLRTFQLNGLSNNHGESWGQALLFTFAGAAVAYAAYLWAIGQTFDVHAPIDWDLAGQYFNFLDPTHKEDFIKDAEQGFCSRFIHFLGRIWVGYGIFQFISAFRKHGKR